MSSHFNGNRDIPKKFTCALRHKWNPNERGIVPVSVESGWN